MAEININENDLIENIKKQTNNSEKNNSQVLIEDATMAAFGFENQCEVTASRNV